MTELLERAVAAVQQASPDMQNVVARLMLDMLDHGPQEAMSAEDLAAVLQGEAQADKGEFATDAEVAEAFRRFRA